MHAFVKDMFEFWAQKKLRGDQRQGKGERSHRRWGNDIHPQRSEGTIRRQPKD